MDKKKKWTIMIYASGNNELEPEIWRSKLDVDGIVPDSSCNIIIQIGRVNRELVNIIRPHENLYDPVEKWTGVRRYIYKDKSAVFKFLGNINMADPGSLYNFVDWCFINYPAENYILILGGHVYQFVGAMTDYSQDKPYIMGIPEISESLQGVKRNSGSNIDILILDVCYFNYIEILYEFAKYDDHIVSNILTYIYDGPLAGLPYAKIIKTVQEYSRKDLRVLLKNTIDRINRKLVAFDVNYKIMKKIKKLFNRLAEYYLDINDKDRPGLNNFINGVKKDSQWYKEINELQQSLQKLIIYYKIPSGKKDNLINIARKLPVDREKIKLYKRLAFNRQNNWFNIISNNHSINTEEIISDIQECKAAVLSQDALKANIRAMNPCLDEKNIDKIFKELIKYKGWNCY